MSPPRIGLALSGGGARGAFTVGVVEYLALKEEITNFPIISGTSTGALVGTLACTQQWARLQKLYLDIKQENIINPNHPLAHKLLGDMGGLLAAAVLGGQAVFNTTALQTIIDHHVDFAHVKQRAAKSLLILSAVNLRSGEVVRFNNQDHGVAQLSKGLLASASEPVFMDPVSITLDGSTDSYVDGGVRDLIPLSAVYDHVDDDQRKLDGIVVISTNPTEPRAVQSQWNMLDIASRTFELFLTEVGQNDFQGAEKINAFIRVVENAKAANVPEAALFQGVDPAIRRWIKDRHHVPVCFVGPATHLDHSSLDFDAAKMKEMMRMGRERAKEVLPEFLAGITTP